MNDTLYRLSLELTIRAVSLPGLSPALGFALRVLGRQHRLWIHLRALRFDGVIDGGANVGEFARLVRHALPAADLVCIEPHPPSAARLRNHNYRTLEAALWQERTRLSLSQPDPATTSCTCIETQGPEHGRWEVEALPLSEVAIRGNRLLVKLDLQGAELPALRGMGTLWDRTAALLLEMRIGPAGDRPAIEALLREKGYFSYATTNEILRNGIVVEADILWVKEGVW